MIFIEFYHQPGVALPNTGYNRRHAHALVRTPNGNDYGRALLRQYQLKTEPAKIYAALLLRGHARRVLPPKTSAIQSHITSRVSATLSMPQCSAPPSASVCT